MTRVLRLKVELLEIAPPIWRRIEVPGDSTFWDLHVAIQDAMGWADSHLHMFEIRDAGRKSVEIGIPDPDFESGVVAGWTRPLSKHVKKPGDRLVYEYDFGDSWRHSVVLEAVSSAEPGVRYPRCLDGARKCPPEDCGGVPGFEDFLEAIADPDHDEHESMLTWCGGSYDPEDFDPAAVWFDDPRLRLETVL